MTFTCVYITRALLSRLNALYRVSIGESTHVEIYYTLFPRANFTAVAESINHFSITAIHFRYQENILYKYAQDCAQYLQTDDMRAESNCTQVSLKYELK